MGLNVLTADRPREARFIAVGTGLHPRNWERRDHQLEVRRLLPAGSDLHLGAAARSPVGSATATMTLRHHAAWIDAHDSGGKIDALPLQRDDLATAGTMCSRSHVLDGDALGEGDPLAPRQPAPGPRNSAPRVDTPSLALHWGRRIDWPCGGS